ncbi:hypothetical protein Hanom_Chr16g01475131 [Helianthus anomalus]
MHLQPNGGRLFKSNFLAYWNTLFVEITKSTTVKQSLMKFKELFRSFTSHRVENRSTGTNYGSIGSARGEKWKMGVQEAVGDGV